jgi:hypothetical protein
VVLYSVISGTHNNLSEYGQAKLSFLILQQQPELLHQNLIQARHVNVVSYLL